MAAKRQAGSEQAVIEVWREGDRVLIGVPSLENSTSRRDQPPRQVADDQDLRPAQMRYEALSPELIGAGRTKRQERTSRKADAGRVEAEMLAMTEEEWLVANLLALQQEARELVKSVDDTLAHITAGCAAIKAG